MNIISQLENVHIETLLQRYEILKNREHPTADDFETFQQYITNLTNSYNNIIERMKQDPYMVNYFQYMSDMSRLTSEVNRLNYINMDLIQKINESVNKTLELVTADKNKQEEIEKLKEMIKILNDDKIRLNNNIDSMQLKINNLEISRTIQNNINNSQTAEISALRAEFAALKIELQEKTALLELVQIFKCVKKKLHEKYGYNDLKFRELIEKICLDHQDLETKLVQIYKNIDPNPNITITNITEKLKEINDRRDEFFYNRKVKTDKIENNIKFFKKKHAITPELKTGVELMECLINYVPTG